MTSRQTLPLIVLSQFACTSLWFAGNAVIADISKAFDLTQASLSYLTSAVQLGFIVGTLLFAIFTIADRYAPSKVFFVCALLGALFNLLVLFIPQNLIFLVLCRFFTGFMLAGIYPVGMKIAADYHEKGLGNALGWLVGALVLGTAFPHLVKSYFSELPWKYVMVTTSSLAVLGGLLIGFLVPNGPYHRIGARFDPSAIVKVFGKSDFRAAAFGYFGHMWELYTFWAFVPIMLIGFNQAAMQPSTISLLSFIIISMGAIGCVAGGYLSFKIGSKKVAFLSLIFSGTCCLLSYFFPDMNVLVFLIILLVWGLTVVSDSPQFSTLVAQSAPIAYKGTALTIVNSIGFFITIFSIQLVGYLHHIGLERSSYLTLLIGPIFGAISLMKSSRN